MCSSKQGVSVTTLYVSYPFRTFTSVNRTKQVKSSGSFSACLCICVRVRITSFDKTTFVSVNVPADHLNK